MITTLKQPEVKAAERVIQEYVNAACRVHDLPYVISELYKCEEERIVRICKDLWITILKYHSTDFLSMTLTTDMVKVSSMSGNLTISFDVTEHLTIMTTLRSLGDQVPAPYISTSPFLPYSDKVTKLGDDGAILSLELDTCYIHLVAKNLFTECISTSSDLSVHDGHVLQIEHHQGICAVRTSSSKWLNVLVADRVLEKYPELSELSQMAEVANIVANIPLTLGTLDNNPPIHANTGRYAVTKEQLNRLLNYITDQ